LDSSELAVARFYLFVLVGEAIAVIVSCLLELLRVMEPVSKA
jgi:hypothetical protein